MQPSELVVYLHDGEAASSGFPTGIWGRRLKVKNSREEVLTFSPLWRPWRFQWKPWIVLLVSERGRKNNLTCEKIVRRKLIIFGEKKIEHKSNKRTSPSAMDRPNVEKCFGLRANQHARTHKTHTHTQNTHTKRAGLHNTINDSMCENWGACLQTMRGSQQHSIVGFQVQGSGRTVGGASRRKSTNQWSQTLSGRYRLTVKANDQGARYRPLHSHNIVTMRPIHLLLFFSHICQYWSLLFSMRKLKHALKRHALIQNISEHWKSLKNIGLYTTTIGLQVHFL